MNQDYWQEYRRLTRNNIKLQEHTQIRPNHGSETIRHLVAKTLATHVLMNHDYRVSSEVECEHGEIDLVAFHPNRLNYAVELETSPEEGVVEDKLERYVHKTELDDLLFVDLSGMPMDMVRAHEWMENELGV